MTKTTYVGLRAAIATSALALTLVACSPGDDESDRSPGTSESASSGDSSAPTESDTGQGSEASSGDATDEFVARYTAGVEKMMTTAAFTMDVEVAGEALAATGVMDNSTQPPSLSMEMEIPGAGTASVVMVDGEQFVSGGAVGEGWVRVDPSAMAGLGVPTTTDPLEQLRSFREAITGVEERGAEDVEGVLATQYAVTVDTSKIDNPVGAPLPPELTYLLWLDEEDRTVRMVNEIEAEGTTVSTTLTFASFGDPVEISAPPEDEISEMPAVTAMD